jgi:hypothetical protein
MGRAGEGERSVDGLIGADRRRGKKRDKERNKEQQQ